MNKLEIGFTMLEIAVKEAQDHVEDNIKILSKMSDQEFEQAPIRMYGWLLLEEASTETIIKEILIPNFTPSLGGSIRTVSCNGTGNMNARFNALNSLFLTAVHLMGYYHNKAWVIADGDESGAAAIDQLKVIYCRGAKPWKEECFTTWLKRDFEEYYPLSFMSEVQRVLAIKGKRDRADAKRNLLTQVVEWSKKQSKSDLVEAFGFSAKEVIGKLQQIASEVERYIPYEEV